ncbi:hypothetical protein K503DRAFT_772112, partial [Rhizopogon vinicolor AM-OR11-026]
IDCKIMVTNVHGLNAAFSLGKNHKVLDQLRTHEILCLYRYLEVRERQIGGH